MSDTLHDLFGQKSPFWEGFLFQKRPRRIFFVLQKSPFCEGVMLQKRPRIFFFVVQKALSFPGFFFLTKETYVRRVPEAKKH